MQPLILASASPRRRELLKQCGLEFKIIPSHIDENAKSKDPVKIVKALALKKALSVAKKLKKGVVIGADTIVVLKGKIIGKPRDAKEAKKILFALNGSYNKVYSGIAVVDALTGKKKVSYEVTTVKMKMLPEDKLVKLVGKHMDKAGAYAVQEKNDAFVDKIDGDYYNVVGLPVRKLVKLLDEFKVRIPKARV